MFSWVNETGQHDVFPQRHDMTRAASILSWVFLGVLTAAIAYYSLSQYDHNDHMYAVAPVLMQHARLYADFGFVQTPLSALLFAGVFKLTGPMPFYAVLRIISLLLNLGIVGLGLSLCRRHAVHRTFAGFIFAGLYLWFAQTVMIGVEIGNYTLALILAVLALLCLDLFRGKSWGSFAVGLCAGLSLSAKMSSIFLLIAFALLCLAPKPRGVRKTALFGLGALTGALPILYYLIAEPEKFLFENIHFHYLSNIYRGLALVGAGSGLGFFSIGSGAFAISLLLIAALAGWAGWKLVQRLWPDARTLIFTGFDKAVLVFAAAAIVGAVTPGVIFQQYYAAPAFAIFLFLALFLDRRAQAVRIAAIAILVVLGAWRIVVSVQQASERQAQGLYAITAVPRTRDRLAQTVAAIDRAHPACHGDLVTAFGVPAIGAGVRLSPIASAGSFAMRLDYIFAADAPAWRWLSDATLYLTPRSLIMSGFYNDPSYEPRSDFEGVMNSYAAEHHFARLPLGRYMDRDIFLYTPAGCAI